ncbi:MAG TPA: glycosyltransferase family 4 protein [Candidatus Dormibacteraeota bacterium]
MREFVFVLEQTLGHVAHARNIRRALDQHAGSVRSTVIPIEYHRRPGVAARIPGLRTWTFDASRQARSALARRLRRGPVDAVFIHTQVAAHLAASIMQRIPTVVSLDATPLNFDSQGRSYGHSRNRPAVEAVKLQLNRSVFRRAAALVSWCQWAADSLVADYGVPQDKISVIHPGVDVTLFRPLDRAGNRKAVRILFVGGDFERKGGADLLQAMRRFGPLAELDVVTGSPVDPPPDVVCRVHRGLSPQSPEIVNLYREADIFVLPSRGDCFPQAVAEGLACGLPIVASRTGAIPEMVRNGINGWLVPAGDPGDLSRALESLVLSSSLRRRMGLASRRIAEHEHDADANNRRIIELMITVAAAPMRASRIA